MSSAKSDGKCSLVSEIRIRPERQYVRHNSEPPDDEATPPADRPACGVVSRYSTAKAHRSRCIATCLFLCWDRSSLALARIPLARCSIVAAVSTLLRCCPPGPLAREKLHRHCCSSFSKGRQLGCMRRCPDHSATGVSHRNQPQESATGELGGKPSNFSPFRAKPKRPLRHCSGN